jgi:hypothetical protein
MSATCGMSADRPIAGTTIVSRRKKAAGNIFGQEK